MGEIEPSPLLPRDLFITFILSVIDVVQNMQDDLADIYDQHNEIQESLGRSYDVGEIDESELDDGKLITISILIYSRTGRSILHNAKILSRSNTEVLSCSMIRTRNFH